MPGGHDQAILALSSVVCRIMLVVIRRCQVRIAGQASEQVCPDWGGREGAPTYIICSVSSPEVLRKSGMEEGLKNPF